MRRCFELFLISFAILYLELAAIRWFPAYVLSLTFFTNFVLLATFVGMSIGCLAANHRWRVFDCLPSLIAVTIAAALAFYASLGTLTSVRVGESSRPELVYFGVEGLRFARAKFSLQVELIVGVLFVLVSLWFVGLGQVMGRKLGAVEQRILAYTVNISGSLAGIAAFSASAYWEMPPVFWFGIALACVAYFLKEYGQLNVSNATLLACSMLAVAVVGWRTGDTRFYWSPYYAIRYRAEDRDISVNGIGHQKMVPRSEAGIAYALPYIMRRDAGLPAAEGVLIIGAGSGNDVSHALDQGAQHIDAVEIDPAIARLGRENHPDRPYDDPRVRLVIDDGRGFLRRSDKKYDVIVYALVDSLTLHSGYSSARLESFLFTEEALADVRRHLKPGGLFVAYNYFRQGWIIARIQDMMHRAMQCEPLLFSLPPRELIRDTESEETYMAALFAGEADAIDRLRDKLAANGGYDFCAGNLELHRTQNGFDMAAEGEVKPGAIRVTPTQLVRTRDWKLPTDDWPFLYLRDPALPSHNWRMLGLILVLSLGLLALFTPGGSMWINPHFFFLGAGFMLIETKSVVQSAQLFGSTWLVNSVVFSGVLVMILLANLYVWLVRPERLLPYYAALGAALLAARLVPLENLMGESTGIRVIAAVLIMFTPILFAGIIFATSFRRTPSAALAFGANIAGVVLGGLLEYSALVIGYQHLTLVALALYGLSLFRMPSSIGAR